MAGIEKQHKSPAEYLAQNRHIREIRFSGKEELEYQGKSIDKQISILSKTLPEDKGLIAEVFSRYIQLPIILDDFDDEKERNKLEQVFFKENKDVFDFYQSSKLRTTNIRQVLQLFDLWYEMDKRLNPKLIRLAEEMWSDVAEGETKDNLNKYEYASEKEKLRIVEKVSDFARKATIVFIDRNNKKG